MVHYLIAFWLNLVTLNYTNLSWLYLLSKYAHNYCM